MTALARSTRPTTQFPPHLLDEDGYLIDASLWNDVLASQLAAEEGVPLLGDRHWRVIRHIRERYFRVGGVPTMRLVCRATDLGRPEIESLFGSCLSIWRIAGLPNPGEEAKAYM